MTKKVWIAIDGGGTKTAFAAFDATGAILCQITRGASNPNDIGMDACLALLTAGIDALGVRPVALFAGIAGAGVGENKTRIGTYLKNRFPEATVCVESDGVIALAAAPLADGVLIAGTGSVLFVKTPDGPRPVGGWGYLLEQGGSGYCFGRDALRAALAAEDGMTAPTPLTDLLATQLNPPLRTALAEIYTGGKPAIAALAPTVFEAFAVGDKEATRIIHENCQGMKNMILTAKARYGLSRLALCGGLFEGQRETLLPLLLAMCPGVSFEKETALPLLGAAMSAMKLSGERISPDFTENFNRTCEKKKKEGFLC